MNRRAFLLSICAPALPWRRTRRITVTVTIDGAALAAAIERAIASTSALFGGGVRRREIERVRA